MPTYDYRCEECGHEFEEMLTISRRKEPTQTPCAQRILDRNQDPQCFDCGGEVKQIIVKASGFAYDNIKAGKSARANKPPGWMKDKLKEIKRQQPGATMSLPF